MKDDSPKVGQSTGKGVGNRGLGRPKGIPNKIPASVKEMILAALDAVGGQQYLEEQATQNPQAFLSLLGRIIPSEIKVDNQPMFVFENCLPEKTPEDLEPLSPA